MVRTSKIADRKLRKLWGEAEKHGKFTRIIIKKLIVVKIHWLLVCTHDDSNSDPKNIAESRCNKSLTPMLCWENVGG